MADRSYISWFSIFILKIYFLGAGKMAQQLRAIAALPEDTCSSLSTHISWVTTCNPSSEDSIPLTYVGNCTRMHIVHTVYILTYRHTHTYRDTDTHTHM